MIIYELTCIGGHRFEGWFGSSSDFESQRQALLVRCPVCDDPGISKVPFAKVHKGRTSSDRGTEERRSADADPSPPSAATAQLAESAAMPPALAGAAAEILARLRAAVREASDVGQRFAEEARKIHYEEAPARSIRGQATAEEAEALRDEGIEFASLPSFLVDDSH